MRLNDKMVTISETELYFIPIRTRVPLKFGPETLTEVTCARTRVRVLDKKGRTAYGWGETPLSVQWVWPAKIGYREREDALKSFCLVLSVALQECQLWGHPMEIGWDFQETVLSGLLRAFNDQNRKGRLPMPYLAALVCYSLFDIACHDAYGQFFHIPVYQTYNREFMGHDLAYFLDGDKTFKDLFPEDFLGSPWQNKYGVTHTTLPAWHLVGGCDPLDPSESEEILPADGYPVFLKDWIAQDGLFCLKVKLTGTDPDWDYDRLVTVGRIGHSAGVLWLSADFNCQVKDPQYVTTILDKIRDTAPRVYGMLLYVEQPFSYDLERNRIDVHCVSARKPLFMDESAHDWRLIRLGYSLGWTGVALKTCKTQTGALLGLCWAKAHGMTVMVQDLTNPMLAQIPHVQLARHAGTIMGVETNSMQFYPQASGPEAAVHPELFKRKEGKVDCSSLVGYPGFGYRVEEIKRELPEPVYR